MRGEYEHWMLFALFLAGSPPLARGVLGATYWLLPLVRITPACAGSTIVLIYDIALLKDHPRLRGEYYTSAATGFAKLGSPPLARGVRYIIISRNWKVRITPACAGSTIKRIFAGMKAWDHPRLRGEYEKYAGSRLIKVGSPPLARGVPSFGGKGRHVGRITPACAGSTLSRSIFSASG